jgi:hypothetical protein
MLLGMDGGVANGFIFARRPGEPLMERAMLTSIGNIERRLSNNVSDVSGPGMMTRLHGDAATRPLFDGFVIEPRPSVGRAVRFVSRMAYKRTPADWRVAAYFPDHHSIFRDDP